MRIGNGLMFRFWLVACAMASLGWVSPAEARRAALIIGNAAYAHANVLPNPIQDANLVADAARKAGFDVTLIDNLGKADFDQTLREFRTQSDGAEVAMIYYAGHGIENGGKNWVIPTDATLAESRDLRFEAVELDGLLETLVGAQLRIVVLDACRENPFGGNWRTSVRSVPKGLAETEVEGALVLFAAAGGQVATDGTGTNSPFARALAARLAEPGLSIHRLGSVIRQDVIAETGGKQTPWTNMSIDGREFYLVDNAPAGPATQPTATGGDAPGAYNASLDAYSWRYYSEKNTIEAYNGYLREFPQGLFAGQANERIAQLRAGPAVTARPATKPATPKTASAPARPAPVAVVLPAQPRPTIASVGLPPVTEPSSNVVLPATNVVDTAPLPQMPATPLFPQQGYPACREDYQAVADPMGRVNKIIACQNALNSYYETTMNGFARSMIEHQTELTRLYQEQVGGNARYSPESQNRFYKEMMQEHAASNPDGPNFAEYRATQKRYDDDRAYLQDRYCASTGACGGYPVPAGIGKTAP